MAQTSNTNTNELISSAMERYKNICEAEPGGHLNPANNWLSEHTLKNKRRLYIIRGSLLDCQTDDGPLITTSEWIAAIIDNNGHSRIVFEDDGVGRHTIIDTSTRRSLRITYAGRDQKDINLDE